MLTALGFHASSWRVWRRRRPAKARALGSPRSEELGGGARAPSGADDRKRPRGLDAEQDDEDARSSCSARAVSGVRSSSAHIEVCVAWECFCVCVYRSSVELSFCLARARIALARRIGLDPPAAPHIIRIRAQLRRRRTPRGDLPAAATRHGLRASRCLPAASHRAFRPASLGGDRSARSV